MALFIITNTIEIQNVSIINDYYVVRMENMAINKFYKVLIFFYSLKDLTVKSESLPQLNACNTRSWM